MAKVVFTSDLHLGLECSLLPEREVTHDYIKAIARYAYREAPEAIVIAGDIGVVDDFGPCLDHFKGLKCKVGVIPGNHDLWVFTDYCKHNSFDRYREYLPEEVHKRGFTWLEEDNLILSDGTALAGSVAWYDYSLRLPGADLEGLSDKAMAAQKAAIKLNDAFNIDFGFYNDPQFCQYVCSRLLGRLDALEANPLVKKIAVATHVPIFAEQVVVRSFRKAVSASFYGQLTLGNVLRQKYTKLTTVISGHTHDPVPPTVLPRANGLPPLTIATLGCSYLGDQRYLALDL